MDIDPEDFVHLSASLAPSDGEIIDSSSPIRFREIVKTIFYIFWPVYLSLIFQYDMALISIAFSGHLNSDDLAATGLASSIINITVMGIGSGLATGYDTLGSQAYGANNLKRVGILLQKTLIILALASCAIIALWLNIGSLLKAWDEPPDVAVKTEIYLQMFIPGLIGSFVFRSVRSYVQVQGIVKPPVLTCFLCTVLHIIFNYIFVYPMNLGLKGLALASACSMLCMPLALILYIFVSKLYRTTWNGFTTQSLVKWSTFVRLAIVGMLSMLLKPLANETTVILTGLVSTDALGAQAVLYQLRLIAVLMPISVGIAVYMLVGQELGAGRSVRAKAIAKYGLVLNILIAFTTNIFMITCRSVLGRIFTKNPSIVKLVYETIPVVALASFLESIQISLTYITRAIGKPYISVLTTLAGYYILGLPLGIILTFVKKMGIDGLWVGLSCGIFLQCSLLTFILFCRINYQEESNTARKLAGAGTSKTKDYGSTTMESKRNNNNAISELDTKSPVAMCHEVFLQNGRKSLGGEDKVENSSSHLLRKENEKFVVITKLSEGVITKKGILNICLVFLGGFLVLILGIVVRFIV